MQVSARLLQDELLEKQDRVRRFLVERNLDGIWLARSDNFAWYTAGGNAQIHDHSAPGEAGLLVTQDVTFLIASNIEGERLLQEEVAGQSLELRTYEWYKPHTKAELLKHLTNHLRIGADTRWPDFELVDMEFAQLRYGFTPAEQYRYRALCRELTTIVEGVARTIVQGQSEREIAAQVACQFLTVGIQPAVLLVGADSRLHRYSDPLPSDNKVCHYVLVVVVGVRGGLQAALTRMVAVDNIPHEVETRHRAVTRIEANYIYNTRPGRTLAEILEATAGAYAAEGYPEEWRTHFQGGTIGYAPREPQATPDAAQMIRPYQAVAWLPCIQGIKSEDTFLVLPDRNEVLTKTDDWPMVEIQLKGETYYRPDILRL